MSKESVVEILDDCQLQIADIKKSDSIKAVRLKNVLENFRSTLDYIAMDITTAIESSKDRVYFPYGPKSADFKRNVKHNLPGLEEKFPSVYSKLESIQSYMCDDFWLINLCKLTNNTKHRDLARAEGEKLTSASLSGIANIPDLSKVERFTASNNYFNGQRLDDVEIRDGNITVTKKGDLAIEIVENSIMKFQGRELEIFPFLDKCQSEISELSNRIYSLLPH